MPVAAYRERVRKSADALDSLRWSPDEQSSEASRAASAAATLRYARQSVLTVETVEWNNGASLRVDNAWLDQAFKDYEKISSSDASARADALLRIEERLYALSERLVEVEGGKTTVSGGGKDEEKARLAAILRRDEYGKKVEEESALMRLLRSILRWLANLFPKVKPIRPGASGRFTGLVQILVIIISLALIAFLLWRYGPRLLITRSRSGKRGPGQGRVVLGEHLEADQTAADLLAEAEALARGGELRAAIRKGYIALLCELGDRKILRLAQSKTNRDYLSAVRDRKPLYEEMRALTRVFENHWYGSAPATPNDWTIFRAGYEKAVTSERQEKT